MAYNDYKYTFSMTLRDAFDNTDTTKIDFKASSLQNAIGQIERFVNTFLNSAGYTWYDKDRILLTSISDEEETALLDILGCYRKNDVSCTQSTSERKEYLKLEISCVPIQSYLTEYNNVIIEKEFTVSDFSPFEYYIGKNLNALLNYHCNDFNNYTVFPYSVTNEEKKMLLNELEKIRKAEGEKCEQYKQQ